MASSLADCGFCSIWKNRERESERADHTELHQFCARKECASAFASICTVSHPKSELQNFHQNAAVQQHIQRNCLQIISSKIKILLLSYSWKQKNITKYQPQHWQDCLPRWRWMCGNLWSGVSNISSAQLWIWEYQLGTAIYPWRILRIWDPNFPILLDPYYPCNWT